MAKKDIPQQQELQDNTQFLNTQRFLYERILQGIEVHPSDAELKEFQRIAKTIDNERYFTIYGCQSCIQELIKFVYENTK